MRCRSVWTEACPGKRLSKSLTHSATQTKVSTSPTRCVFKAETKSFLTSPHIHAASFLIRIIKIRMRGVNGATLSLLSSHGQEEKPVFTLQQRLGSRWWVLVSVSLSAKRESPMCVAGWAGKRSPPDCPQAQCGQTEATRKSGKHTKEVPQGLLCFSVPVIKYLIKYNVTACNLHYIL